VEKMLDKITSFKKVHEKINEEIKWEEDKWKRLLKYYYLIITILYYKPI
jgi:hypothetical protein